MLRPTFYSFETAKRALASSQLGLDTVGHNISNVNTPGYTRQRVDQVTFNLGYGRSQFSSFGYHFPGQGAEVSGINQIRDPYLDRRFRTEAAKVGELGTISSGLDKLNQIFDEIQKTGSHAKMSEFLTELDALIAGADSPEQATILRSKAQDLALVLNKNSIDLENAATQQMEEMEASIGQVNVLLEQIADLNVKIKEDNFYGNPSNENNDLRNLYIDQLSELIDIDIIKTPVEVTPDFSVESVKIAIKGSKPPAVLVDSSLYNSIQARYKNPLKPYKDKDEYEYLDEVSYHLVDGMTKLPILKPGERTGDGDITNQFMTGALKGHLDIMNGKGTDAKVGESSYRGLPYTQKALDDYARVLAEQMNELNAVKIWNPNLNGPGAGGYASIPRDLFVASGATDDVTEYTRMGLDPDGSGELVPVATMLDGTKVNASKWRFVDTETGDILDIANKPILVGGNPLNVKDFERKLTARNIATSKPWQDDPLYITRETLNNAIYTGPSTPGAGDEGRLKVRDENGDMVDTGISFDEVVSIGAGGTLIDADGEPLQYDGEDLTLDMLQKAMTEEALKPPAFEDFFPGLDITQDITFKNGTVELVPPPSMFQKLDPTGKAYEDVVADTGFDGWSIDKEGYLLDDTGSRVYLDTDSATAGFQAPNKPFNVSELAQQTDKVTMADIPPTFGDYFPGGKVSSVLTITEMVGGKPVDQFYKPGDFGPGTYKSFAGWSVDDTGMLVDADKNPVFKITDIALDTIDLVVQADFKNDGTPSIDESVNPAIEHYLNEDNQIEFKDGREYDLAEFGPGSYSSYKGWLVDNYGAIRDADGNRVYPAALLPTVSGATISVKDPPRDDNLVGLKQRNYPQSPASIGDFLNAAGNLVQKTTAEGKYQPDDFIGADGTTYTDFTDWSIDDEGYLLDGPYNPDDPSTSGQRVSLIADPSRKVNVNDLVLQTDPAPHYEIGDPTPNNLLPGEKANGNLDQMKIKLTESRTFPNGFKGNFQEYLIGFQEDLANDKQTNDSLLNGSVNVLNGLADSRDGISAVSIDEEGISMMTYQNYYNAASRYMTTLDEALDKIINGMGTVGR